MALRESLEVFRLDLFNASLIHFTRSNQPRLNQLPQPPRRESVILVVVGSHRIALAFARWLSQGPPSAFWAAYPPLERDVVVGNRRVIRLPLSASGGVCGRSDWTARLVRPRRGPITGDWNHHARDNLRARAFLAVLAFP